MKATITGGLGLIGSSLARRLVQQGADVTIVDANKPESSANMRNIASIRDSVKLELVDLTTATDLVELLSGQDVLFNLAGQSSHMASMIDPLADLDINCRAQLVLLEACRRANRGISVVFASTRQIYGRPLYLPVDERHALSPIDVNGIGKMAGEAFHSLYWQAFDVKACSLRFTNTYGPGMRIKDAQQTFIGFWIRNLIEGKPLELWGGAQKRDFTYVDDAVDALLLAAACPQMSGLALNVGGSEVVTLDALAELLVAINGSGTIVVREFPEERKRIDIGDYYADDRMFRNLTNWNPAIGLQTGIERTLNYYRDQFAYYV